MVFRLCEQRYGAPFRTSLSKQLGKMDTYIGQPPAWLASATQE